MAHGLNLLVDDDPDKLVPAYPPGYPCEYLLDFVNECKGVVLFFDNHQIPKAKLQAKQLEANVPLLVKPGETRWSSLLGRLVRLKKTTDLLYSLVNERDFVSCARQLDGRIRRQELKAFFSAETTIPYLDKSIAILQPIDGLLIKFQGIKMLPENELNNRGSYCSFRS